MLLTDKWNVGNFHQITFDAQSLPRTDPIPASSFSYAELSMDWGRDRLERPLVDRSQLDSVRDICLTPSIACVHQATTNCIFN